MIDSQWLKDQILKYEFIPEDKFKKYSNVNNWKDMFDERAPIFLNAYSKKRDDILNN